MADLKKAGFVNRGGAGSHRNYEHPTGTKLCLSGSEGKDAKKYQEKEVKSVIAKAKEEAG